MPIMKPAPAPIIFPAPGIIVPMAVPTALPNAPAAQTLPHVMVASTTASSATRFADAPRLMLS